MNESEMESTLKVGANGSQRNFRPSRLPFSLCFDQGKEFSPAYRLAYPQAIRPICGPPVVMSRVQLYHIKLGTKPEGVEAHSKWVCSVSPTDICAYSDGSSIGHGRSSWGFVLQRGDVTFEKGRGALHGGKLYDAEIVGATAALKAAILARRFWEKKIFVLLDNQAVVQALQIGKTTSCLQKTRICHHVARKVNAVVRLVPGHSKITVNEEADEQARAALQELPAPQSTPEYITLAYLRRLMYQRRQDLIDERWSKVSPARYKELDLQMRRRRPPELHLSRRLLHGLLAARTGHGDFAAYYRRFHHEDANLKCDCGLENSPTHSFRCRKNAAQDVSPQNLSNYRTDPVSWTCGCEAFLLSRFFICKHIVSCFVEIQKPVQLFSKIRRQRSYPFWVESQLNLSPEFEASTNSVFINTVEESVIAPISYFDDFEPRQGPQKKDQLASLEEDEPEPLNIPEFNTKIQLYWNRFNTQPDNGNFKYVEKFMIMMAGILTHFEEIEQLENCRGMPMPWSAKMILPTIYC
ncbi:hypothetical protein K3495_g13811 [Podosphaera aphanis]|nr:hypothetical protein K3495_g13811 [Podosphaera aphanis]